MTQKRRPLRRNQAAPTQQRESMATNPQLAAAVLAMVDKQLHSGTPPEVRATFERLVNEGYAPEGARQLLAQVVVSEVFDVMARGERYDQARFIEALHNLPALPASNDLLQDSS